MRLLLLKFKFQVFFIISILLFYLTNFFLPKLNRPKLKNKLMSLQFYIYEVTVGVGSAFLKFFFRAR